MSLLRSLLIYSVSLPKNSRCMHDEIPIAGFVDKLRLYARRLQGIVIGGDSMHPTLKTGDRVLIDKTSPVAIGDVVVAHHPFKSSVKIVKRVSSVAPDGNI